MMPDPEQSVLKKKVLHFPGPDLKKLWSSGAKPQNQLQVSSREEREAMECREAGYQKKEDSQAQGVGPQRLTLHIWGCQQEREAEAYLAGLLALGVLNLHR